MRLRQQVKRGPRGDGASSLMKSLKCGSGAVASAVEKLMRGAGIVTEELGSILAEPWHILDFYRAGDVGVSV